METLTFTLKQHTPMLHFQASQEGATLRASDVKPRFDRWLIKEVWDDNFDKCCPYLVGYSDKFSEKERNDFKKKFKGGFRALNYKMRIVSNKRISLGIETTDLYKKNAKLYTTTPYPGPKKGDILVLSNLGGKPRKDDLHNFSICDTVTIEIRDCDKDIITEAEKRFPMFIYRTSFGSRGRKGFGHFSVIKINGHNYKYKQSSMPDVYKMMTLILKKDNKNQPALNYKDVYTDIFRCIFLIDKSLKRLQERTLKKREIQLLGITTMWPNGSVPKHLPSPIFYLPLVTPIYDDGTTVIREFKVDLFYRLDKIEIEHIPFKLSDDKVCEKYHSLIKKVTGSFQPSSCTFNIKQI